MLPCDSNKYDCGLIVPSSCVPYTGKDLTILVDPTDLDCRANVNDVIFILDANLKRVSDSIDLTGLNKRCLIFDPATVTVAELSQVQIDKICGLDASLTGLTEQVNNLDIATLEISINLLCLAPAAAPCLSPSNTYPLIAVLNAMVAEICALKTAVGI